MRLFVNDKSVYYASSYYFYRAFWLKKLSQNPHNPKSTYYLYSLYCLYHQYIRIINDRILNFLYFHFASPKALRQE